ncbi:MAG: hypothetical protein AAF652_19715 [Cyanobacteria bacterium P01_C01_bin.72]
MKSTLRKTHWLEKAEIAAAAGTLGGAVTSVVLQQFFWVTIPLSVSAGLAMVNYQRLKQLVDYKQEAITILIQANQAQISQLEQESEQYHRENEASVFALKQASKSATAELEQLRQEQTTKLGSTTDELQSLQTSMAKLDELTQKLEQEQNETRKLAKELKAIEKFTRIINNNGNSAQPYLLRGSAYQRSGNILRAIDDFTKVIELRNDHAKAYHQRGLLYIEIEETQKAIIDLRRASQYYIGKGDLEQYRQTRDLSLKLHSNHSSEAENTSADSKPESEAVAVGRLFS